MIHQSTECVFGINLGLVVNINKTVNIMQCSLTEYLPDPPEGVEPGLAELWVVPEIEEVVSLLPGGQLLRLQPPLPPLAVNVREQSGRHSGDHIIIIKVIIIIIIITHLRLTSTKGPSVLRVPLPMNWSAGLGLYTFGPSPILAAVGVPLKHCQL